MSECSSTPASAVRATPVCSQWHRRDWLRIGTLATLGAGVPGLGLSDFQTLRQLSASETSFTPEPKAKSCILIWLDGGPSHLETFDPKPDAPSEVRGPLDAIHTSIPGVGLSECLPKLASRMEDLAIIRSMTSPLGEHNFGTHYMMTGHKPNPVIEYPAYGSTLALHRGANLRNQSALPPNIAVPNFAVGGSTFSGSGFLPSSTRPFSIGSDPSSKDYQVRDLEPFNGLDLKRLKRRRDFTTALNQFALPSLEIPSEVPTETISGDVDLDRAFRLIGSKKAQEAFQIELESAQTRQSYGPKSIGQCCLLARRLIERGVPFVTVNNRGWDTHQDMVTRLKDGFTGARTPIGLVPSLDLAVSALIDDLKDRGMLDETLVVVMGEFGRTPKLNTSKGRDHWPRVFSVMLAGGGIAGGQVYGTSDAVGESPKDDPVTPSDLAATIYQLLGVSPSMQLRTDDGRPIRLTPEEAFPISRLIG
ncbi:MAG: DUF1501 domain-containing protein [Aureliella sp.]